jgi:hypothetical protein
MPRSVQKVSTVVRADFSVYDSANAPVTGLMNGDFTKLLSKNGVDDATAVTVSEIGSGRYSATFTPATVGVWYLLVRHATYNKRGWEEQYDVTNDGIGPVDAIESGYDIARTLRNIAAGTAGKVSGLAAGSPVFRNQADTADQITATTDVDGNRTVVTHGS